MNKISIYLIIIINFYSLSVLAIDNLKLIKLEDVQYIFDSNIQKWNQNVNFFEKKKSMEKITNLGSNIYSLKSNFKKGYVILTPEFNTTEMQILDLIYNVPNFNFNLLQKIQIHFDQMEPNFCNSITVKNKYFINIELFKC